MSLEERFNDLLEQVEGENAEPEGFKIDDDKKASWALKIIKNQQEEAERLKTIADAQIAELEEKKKAIDDRLSHRIGFLKYLLKDYFESVPHKETKTQESYKLLDGSLVYKKPVQKLVPDKEKLLAYVKQNNMPEFVKVKEEVDWAAYKKECEISDGRAVNVQTGDILPDDVIKVEEEAGCFDVKF